MKFIRLVILLFICFVSVQAHAVDNGTGGENRCFKACNAQDNTADKDIDFANPDIEINGFNSSALKLNQGFQKLQEHLILSFDKQFTTLSGVLSKSRFLVELFGNSYLFHNYPSHNLW